MRNQKLFNDVAEYFRRHPETHDQSTWARFEECGTYRCILGTALYLEGMEEQAYWEFEETKKQFAEASFNKFSPTFDGADLFGITFDEANVLFNGGWMPRHDLLLDEALEKLGAGAHIKDVTDEVHYSYAVRQNIISSHT